MSSAAIAPTHAGQLVRLRDRAAARLRAVAKRLTVPAALRRLAEMPMTVAGIGCIDAAPFLSNVHVIVGLVVTGLSLIGLEYVIADDE